MFGLTESERTRLLAAAGITGVAEFVVAILTLHIVGGIPEHMSNFAHGRYPWLWAGGAFGLALGGICLTLAVRPYLPSGSNAARVAWGLLWLACLAALAVAAFPVDDGGHRDTVAGFVHDTAASSTFTFLALGMLTLGNLRGHSLHGASRMSLITGGVLVFLVGCYVLTDVKGWSSAALVQRALVASVVLWFTVLAMTLLRTPLAKGSEPTLVPDDEPVGPATP